MQKKCGIILFNEETNEFLLVYGKKSNKWGFPKGHNEEGETEIETATREFMEETGYTIDINQFSWNKKFTTLKIDYIKKTEELKSDKWKDKTKKYFMNYWETISCPLKESVWYNPDYIPMTLKKLN